MNTNIEEEIKKALFHDAHKVFRTKHNTLNEIKLSTSADVDAAKLSRPVMANKRDKMNGNYLNKSFISEKFYTEKDRREFEKYFVREYLRSNDDTQILHEKFINDSILSNFNEITSMPYTSLKYHSLLVTALHYNYLKGRDFKDLYLNFYDNTEDRYTTIFKYKKVIMAIDDNKEGSNIGFRPTTNFGDTIGRINTILLPDFVIENLRRFRSWSVGLQYLDDTFIKLNGSDRNI